jgi:hypothetical protein
VETLRLHKIQPSQAERLLDACIARSNVLPKDFYQIHDPGPVPRGLQLILSQASDEGKVWSCLTNSSDTWLFTCAMSLPLSRTRGRPVLEVSLRSQDGALKDSDTWTADPQGMWTRSREGLS